MNEGKNAKGFGFIELLVVVVFVGFFVGLYVDYMKGGKGVGGKKSYHTLMKESFAEEFENNRGNILKLADLDVITFERSGIERGFRYGGEKPFGTIEKLTNEGWAPILENVSFLRFVYYDKRGELILDQDALKNPSKVARIKVDAMVHNGSESKKYFISDGYRGIDLDGDKSNGVAKLTEVKFLVDVN